MVKRKWIVPLDEGGRKKEYVITDAGKLIVESEVKRLYELHNNGLKITKGENQL